MGYETRIYVVDKKYNMTNNMTSNGKTLADVIAMYELRTAYAVSDKTTKYPDTDCFIIGDDGNTDILVDACGKALREVPIADLISILEDAIVSDSLRRDRYIPLLQMLKALDPSEYTNLVTLHFGH